MLIKTIGLKDINLLEVGTEIFMSGAIWKNREKVFLTLFPDAEIDKEEICILKMNVEDWKKFLKQTDIQETEILKKDENGFSKSIVRKSARILDSHMQWRVYRRDHYKCRYCGRDGVPLTVDHIITWENGGATIEENLLTACRKCNKDRGSEPYDKWIESSEYKRVSQKLDDLTKRKNLDIVSKLLELSTLTVEHKRSR